MIFILIDCVFSLSKLTLNCLMICVVIFFNFLITVFLNYLNYHLNQLQTFFVNLKLFFF